MSSSPLNFPDLVAPKSKKKSKKYILDYVKAIWWNEYQGVDFYSTERRNRMIENINWSTGQEDITYLHDCIATGDNSYSQMNWNVANPIVTLVNDFVNRTTSRDYDLVCEAYDITSKGEYDKELARRRGKLRLKKEAAEFAQNGIQIMSEEEMETVPDTLEEIEIDLELNYKAPFEEAYQGALQYVFQNNRDYWLRRRIAFNLMSNQIAATRTDYDEFGNPRIRAVQIPNFIYSYFTEEDASDWRYFGEVQEMEISELIKETNGEFNKEDIFRAAYMSQGKWGNRSWEYGKYDEFRREVGWDDIQSVKVLVLDFIFRSADKFKWRKKQTGKGSTYRFEMVSDEYDEKGKHKVTEVVDKTVETIYGGKWVVETNFIYDYGMKKNLLRKKIDGLYESKVQCPYKVVAPNILDMNLRSKVEQMRPIAEFMMLLDLKRQQLINESRPSGLAINSDALQGAGMAYDSYDEVEAQKMFDETGTIYYSLKDEAGQPINDPQPVRQLVNGLPQDIIVLQQMYDYGLQKLYEITGFNQTTSIDKDAAVGIEKIKEKAHQNSIKHLTEAYTKLIEATAENVVLLVRDSIAMGSGMDKAYSKAIGKERVDMINLTKDLSLAEIGVKINYRPTDLEMEQMERDLGIALDRNQISIDMAMIVRRVSKQSIKTAERVMQHLMKKFRKVQQEQSMALQQQNAEVQSQAARVAEEEKRKTLEAQAQKDAAVLNAEYDRKERYLELEYEKKKELAVLEGEIKQDLLETAKDGEESTLATNTTKAANGGGGLGMPKAPTVRTTPRPEDDVERNIRS